MSIQENGTVRENQALSHNIFALTIDAPRICALAQPGQFVHITCGDANLLRRPISICQAHDGILKIVFVVKGDGTKWLSQRRAGDVLDIVGPAGHGFDMTRLGEKPVFIGGGIGVPPMLGCALHGGRDNVAVLGFRSAQNTMLLEEFSKACEIGRAHV